MEISDVIQVKLHRSHGIWAGLEGYTEVNVWSWCQVSQAGEM